MSSTENRAWLMASVLAALACTPGTKPSTEREQASSEHPGETSKPIPTFAEPDPALEKPSELEILLLDLPPYDPSKVVPMEVVKFDQPVGKGYERVPLEVGPPLYEGKWLGLANGQGETLGPRHLLVNEYSAKPTEDPREHLVNNLVIDIESGAILAEFERVRSAEWGRGLVLFNRKDDPQPYLLDVQTGREVSAVPEGEHDYVLGENYGLRYSAVGPYIWVTAKDGEGTIHLFAWMDLSKPPPMPDNPFPFLPERWNPKQPGWPGTVDSEEVLGESEACDHALLTPPKDFLCISEFSESEPLAGGWRVQRKGKVYNLGTMQGHDATTIEGYDLDSLCPGEDSRPVSVVTSRIESHVSVVCSEAPDVLMRWTPPGQVERLDGTKAMGVDYTDLMGAGPTEIWVNYPPEVHAAFDRVKSVRELVGDDYACESLRYRSRRGNERSRGLVCRSGWAEVYDVDRDRRSRFSARDLVVGEYGVNVAVLHRGNQDVVATVSPQ